MSLEQWLRNGSLREHQATVTELQMLFAVVERERANAAVQGLSADGRFMHAYDAALMLGKIALHTAGYEVGKGAGFHALTINSLEHTIGQKETMIYLSQCS